MTKQKLQQMFLFISDPIEDALMDNADERAKYRRISMLTGAVSAFASNLIGGSFFTALMLALGAGDVYMGYVSVVTMACSFIQLIAPIFWEKLQKRKGLMIAGSAISAFLNMVVITIIPFLPVTHGAKLVLFMAVTVAVNLLNYFCSPASAAWSTQYIPLHKRVSYSTLSNLITTIIGLVTTFLASLFFDSVRENGFSIGTIDPTLTAIVILRVLAVVCTVYTTIKTCQIKEFPYEKDERTKINLSLLLLPLQNKAFLLVISVPIAWTFVGSLIGQYFSLYIVDRLQMSYTFISLGGMISTPMVLLITPIWSTILRKRPWFQTLGVAFFGYSLAYLANVFITKNAMYVYIIAIILGNLFGPGVNIVIGNAVYTKLPAANQTAYLSFYSILSQIFALLGSLAGTLFIGATDGMSLTILGFEMCNIQLLFALSVVLALFVAAYTFLYGVKTKS